MKAGICGSSRQFLHLLESPCYSPGCRGPVFPSPLPAQRNPRRARLHTHTKAKPDGVGHGSSLHSGAPQLSTELSSGIPVYDLDTEAVMNMRGDGRDGVLKVSFVGRTVAATEPTERVSGTGARG